MAGRRQPSEKLPATGNAEPTVGAASAIAPDAPRVPRLMQLTGWLSVVVIVGPILALAIRVDWARFIPVLTEPETRSLLSVTLYAAVQATVLTVLLGVPLAVLVSSSDRIGARIVRLLVLLPLAMPPVVAGLALTAALGRRGLAAPILDALGLQFAFAFPGVVLAHVFVALPFVVVAVDSALRSIDQEVLRSAASVGMHPGAVFWRITLPAIAPAVASGAGLAFARSLGEFGTTLTFAGSMPGVTRTMPIGIYLERELDQSRAYVLAAILVVLAVLVLCAAALPGLFLRPPAPRPRRIAPLDPEELAELSAPRPDAAGAAASRSDAADPGLAGASSAGPELRITTRGITTFFPPATITALIGPNGSGKTTLAGLLAGRLRGAEVGLGSAIFDAPGHRFVPAHERGVVLLTQNPGLPRTATVRRVLTMVTRDKTSTERLLKASGLGELADTPVPALSGGQAAQVALVRALASRPRVLILDEPLAAIDVESAARWRRLLRAGSSRRTTIVITHDPVDLAGLAERVVVMDGGRSLAQLPVDEFFRVPPTDFAARLAREKPLEGPANTAAGFDTCGKARSETGHEPAPRPANPPEEANRWFGRVLGIDASHFGEVIVTVELAAGAQLTAPLSPAEAAAFGLEVGGRVTCEVSAEDVRVRPVRS